MQGARLDTANVDDLRGIPAAQSAPAGPYR
jgi:hypothetical protein